MVAAGPSAGLRFGVTNHSAHAWTGSSRPMVTTPRPIAPGAVRCVSTQREDGKGKRWDGLDPQQLYTGPNLVMPDGIRPSKRPTRGRGSRSQVDGKPPANAEFVERWFLRCQELVDRYQPDLLDFDDTELPLGQAGLDIAAHFYNANIHNHGHLEAVLTSKGLKPDRVDMMVLDIERGRADRILAEAWQTDTCIGDCTIGAPPSTRTIQVGPHRHQDPRRHRQQERQSVVEHPAARRRHDRRGRAADSLDLVI